MTQELFEHLKTYVPGSVTEDGEVMYRVPMPLIRKPLGWPGDEKWWLYKQLNKNQKGGET